MSTSRGPRAARGEIRERLVKAARSCFWERDYGTVTVREIADEAGVDPALVSYYFGGKANLFREAMSLPDDPVDLVMGVFEGDRATLGYRALMTAMALWEESGMSSTVKVLIRSLLGSESTMSDYRQWVDEAIVTPAARILGGEHVRYRMENGISHIIGLLLVRYMAEVEPIASMSREELTARHGPVVQALFMGHLAGPGPLTAAPSSQESLNTSEVKDLPSDKEKERPSDV